MVLRDSYPDEYAYTHGKRKSVIDYIIVSNKESINTICAKLGQITDIFTSTALECAPQKKQKPKTCKKFGVPN